MGRAGISYAEVAYDSFWVAHSNRKLYGSAVKISIP